MKVKRAAMSGVGERDVLPQLGRGGPCSRRPGCGVRRRPEFDVEQFDGIDSWSALQPLPSCENRLAAPSGCEEGPLSSATPWVEPLVIAM